MWSVVDRNVAIWHIPVQRIYMVLKFNSVNSKW